MAPKLHLNKGGKSHRVWLYSVVFASKLSAFVVLLLFVSFMVQPFHKAFAIEEVPKEAVEEPVANTALDVREQVSPEEEIQEDVTQEVEVTEEPEASTEELDNEDSKTENLDESSDSGTATSTVTEEENEDENNPQVLENDENENSNSNATTTVENVENFDDEVENVEPIIQPDEENEPEQTGVVTEAQSILTDDNFYQFSKQSCVVVGDGTYHCSKVAESDVDSKSVVFAELGENKNNEIYLRTSKGDIEEITHNYYDDTAPFYDADTKRIVWQRLIDGRYQIVVYDIEKGEETQLTFSRNNNMEPKVSSEGIVWQAWDGNDWEIMYFDGTYTDQITDNDSQDVTPVIDDGYILWSVLGSEEQEAKVYSLSNKQIMTITGYEGGTIANPRFVLVYDTKFENGDIVTQGFDPITGLSAPIAAKPAENPVDIPNSDSTGEIRALIQNKSSQKDEFDLDDVNSDSGNTDTASSTATSTAKATVNTLVLGQATSSDDTLSDIDDFLTPASTTIQTNFELTEYDLVIVPSVETGEMIVSTTSFQEVEE